MNKKKRNIIINNEKKNQLQKIEYNKVMSSRQIQMIAIGGTIGSGLFLGSSNRLKIIGPLLIIIYLICGFFCFFIMRALGELISYRPSSGSFISYSREFLGIKAGYFSGWIYFMNWVMTGIVDITAISLYMRYWYLFNHIPQWLFSLITIFIIGIINIIGVKWFAEIEFWLSFIKVLSIIIFIIIGIFLLFNKYIFHFHYFLKKPIILAHNFFNKNGKYNIFPHGMWQSILLTQGVIFSFASIELIGITSEECKNPKIILPKVINSVFWRIMFLYIGSISLLILLLPLSLYKRYESPFVTFLHILGIPYINNIMNFIIITAALSSLNSGLYSVGRILRSMALDGVAPKILGYMNKNKVPYTSIISTLFIYIIGIYINYLFPNKIFEIFLNLASLFVIISWIFILICQIQLRKAINQGKIKKIDYKMPGAPFTTWLTLTFLFFMCILIFLNYPDGTYATVYVLPIIFIILYLGWLNIRKNF
ncbi:amino acid permease [Enterobacteriaceae endosymbiont of Donacia thalassina]|uniref:amino acid permease n=1 Tax=Enterobacteriaceae endosymbiont of Donacia thalassina TaxID=2675786 RepID=UPI0014492233|nr:amino acid permease [Enterobacteriaceae endosymbiont of Donacia thalassina]QJC37315.1 amino acid permease [Enterobacteriaceae endosymbiont of Donacia thalassina]